MQLIVYLIMSPSEEPPIDLEHHRNLAMEKDAKDVCISY